MSVRKVPEPMRAAAKRARKAGWRIRFTGSGHLRWTSPTGESVVTMATPSDVRSTRNAITALRRAGLKEAP